VFYYESMYTVFLFIAVTYLMQCSRCTVMLEKLLYCKVCLRWFYDHFCLQHYKLCCS